MEKQKITGSEALLKALIAEGVDTIFGYPGGQVIPIYDHLWRCGDPHGNPIQWGALLEN